MKKEVKYLIADKLELFGLKINKRFWDIVEYKIYFFSIIYHEFCKICDTRVFIAIFCNVTCISLNVSFIKQNWNFFLE